jgi:hemerythrin-like domain-containing protein
MKPTSILSHEHRVIEQGLSCLEQIAERVKTGQPFPKDDVLGLIDFFRNFADKCHHHKEEAHLFTALEQHGFSRENGPVAAMLAEHDMGRNHIASMLAFIDGAADGDNESRSRFITHALSYVLLLRAHIMKEDNILFPMADRTIEEAAQQEMLVVFDRVEKEEMGEGTHERFHAMIDTLSEKYGVVKASDASAKSQVTTCCHH